MRSLNQHYARRFGLFTSNMEAEDGSMDFFFEMLEAINCGGRTVVSMGQVLRLCLFAKPTISQEG